MGPVYSMYSNCLFFLPCRQSPTEATCQTTSDSLINLLAFLVRSLLSSGHWMLCRQQFRFLRPSVSCTGRMRRSFRHYIAAQYARLPSIPFIRRPAIFAFQAFECRTHNDVSISSRGGPQPRPPPGHPKPATPHPRAAAPRALLLQSGRSGVARRQRRQRRVRHGVRESRRGETSGQ
jgi:hypothetical protein